MADDPSQEKTEEPTSKRLKDARDKGQNPRSKDLNSFIVLIFSGVAFVSLGPMFFTNFGGLIRGFISFDPSVISSNDALLDYAKELSVSVLTLLLPFFFISLLGAVLGPILIGGWSFSVKALAPKANRMSIAKGIKRMFSAKSLMELVKAFLKFSIVAIVAIIVWRAQIKDFLTIGSLPIMVGIPKAFTILAWSFIYISSSLLILVAIDVPFQLYEHKKTIKNDQTRNTR